jgi:hypothetical protein
VKRIGDRQQPRICTALRRRRFAGANGPARGRCGHPRTGPKLYDLAPLLRGRKFVRREGLEDLAAGLLATPFFQAPPNGERHIGGQADAFFLRGSLGEPKLVAAIATLTFSIVTITAFRAQ